MTSIKQRVSDILRNKEFLGSLAAVVIFAVIAVAYFWPDVMQGNVLRQHDVMQGAAIGQEVVKYQEETGEISRWTNSLFSGMPTFQITPSYKSSGLIHWIGEVYNLGLPFPANLVFIMMLGFYILMKAVRMRWYIAIPGAIAWAFSTYFFIIIGAGHIWKYVTLAYIPPTIAGVIWAYRGKYLLGGVVAALFATLQLAANHVQMTYYSLFLIAGLAVAFLVSLARRRMLRQWLFASAVLLFAAVLAGLANSPNLYNTYKYSKETMRGGHSELAAPADNANASAGGLDRDYITAWSYGSDELLTLLVPNAKGGANIKPEKGESKPLLLSDTPAAKEMLENGSIDSPTYQALGSFYQYFGDQPMTNGPVYVGALIFALFIFGCIVVKGPVKWAILVVTVLTVFLSLGRNMMWFTDLFIDYFPMYNKFRTVSSILVIAELTMPLLAMMGLQKLIVNRDNFNLYKRPLYISFGVSAFLCFLLWLAPSLLIGNGFPADEYAHYASQGLVAQYPQLFTAISNVRHAMVESDALRSLIIIAVSFLLILIYSRGKISSLAACSLLSLLILLDLFSVNKRYINSDSFTQPLAGDVKFTLRPADSQILTDTTMNYRVMDISRFTEAMPSYFHRTIGGYHAAKLSRYQDIIDRHIAGKNGINPQVLNMLNAKYFIVDDNTVQLNPDALGNAWFVDKLEFVSTPNDEIDALGSIPVDSVAVADRKFAPVLDAPFAPKQPGDTIFETSYAPNRLTYHYDKKAPGLAVFSEVYFPWGWYATVDGAPVEIGRVNYILRAINLPAGSHTVEFVFNPQSVNVTETLAIISIAIIYIGMFVILFFTFCRKKNEVSETELNDIIDD